MKSAWFWLNIVLPHVYCVYSEVGELLLIYILAAFLCSLSSILLTSRLAASIPTGGAGYELQAIAAAVIGGASLSGAQGSILGTVLGIILMVLITNAGIHMRIDPFVMQIITGALLTIAVVIDQLRQRKS